MLSFRDPQTRRAFLRIGSLGLGGLALPQLMGAREALASLPVVKDRSVVFLFMHGGPAQTETFDPKMEAPAAYRSVTGEVATSLPGVTYGSTFERLAKQAHLTSIVRSFATGDGNHNIKPIVSPDSLSANLGSLYARVAGNNHPETGMPLNTVLFPRAVAPEAGPASNNFGKFTDTGKLGQAYAPFAPSSGGNLQNDMRLWMPRHRLEDRRSLLGRLDNLRRSVDSTGALDGLDRFNAQAYDVILGSIAEAFDISKEPQALRDRYDTSKLVRRSSIRKVWNNHEKYADHVRSLGHLMLLARRLCEAGCGFVTVTTNFVWDMHADKNNATMEEGMRYVGLPFDHAVSAFIEDVEARGLRDKILLVCCGEMGRNPKINKKGGRDHWGRLAPLMFYGGGLQAGRVVGRSDAYGGEPNSTPISIPNLIATLFHQVFDVGGLRVQRGVPRDLMALIENGEPIAQLL